MLQSHLLLSVQVIAWTILKCPSRRTHTRIVFTGPPEGIFPKRTLIQLADVGKIGEEVAIAGSFLPPLRLPEVVRQFGDPFAFGDFVHSEISLQGPEGFLESGSDLTSIHLQKVTEFGVIHGDLRIQLDRLDDRVQHFSHSPAMHVFWLSGREVSMVPHLYLLVQIDAHHGRSNQEETVFRVQREIGPEGQSEDEEHFLIGQVAKLRQPVRNTLSENGALLVEPAQFLIGPMREVIHPHDCLLLRPQHPHPLKGLQHALTVNHYLVLLHRLHLTVAALPDLAVAVVQDGVVPALGKGLPRRAASHFIFNYHPPVQQVPFKLIELAEKKGRT